MRRTPEGKLDVKVLMITPLMDPSHPILGFIPSWVNALAKRVSKLYVATSKAATRGIAYEWASSALRKRVRLPRLRLGALRYAYVGLKIGTLALKLLLRKEVDVVWVHMNPELVLAVSPFVKLMRVPLAFWYHHRALTLKLRLAHALSDVVVTANKEVYPIPDVKVKEVGYGIEPFEVPRREREGTILFVGRVSRVKRIEEALKALKILRQEGLKAELEVVGPIYDEGYLNELKELAKELGVEDAVRFRGAVPHDEVARCYAEASIFVDCCPAFDKSVLEAMLMGLPVVVCDPSFKAFLGEYCGLCMYEAGNPKSLANKLRALLTSRERRAAVGEELKRRVREEHGLDAFAIKLARVLHEPRGPSVLKPLDLAT
jgi:glycosyltransferase involved in cell wall biosynthesis